MKITMKETKYKKPNYNKTAFNILKKKFLLIENDRTVECHTYLVIEAMEEYTAKEMDKYKRKIIRALQ